MLTAEQALDLCEALRGAGVRYWVAGGWGVDALLGRETRPHKDLDVLVLVDDLSRLRRLFVSMGFVLSFVWEESRTIESDGDAWPTAFVVSDATDRLIDVHLIGIENERIVQHYEHQWTLPDRFAATGTISGREVPCVSLEAQLAMHTGYVLPVAHQLDVDVLRQHVIAGTSRRPRPLLVLIPSPLLGPYSWSLVAEELEARGWPTLVSVDLPDDLRGQPRWTSTVGGVEAGLREVAPDCPVVLVAHSAAGPLLPAIGSAIRQPVGAYLFVDARLPSPGISRLDAIAVDDPVIAAERRAELDAGHHFPAWTSEDLRELVPDPDRRRGLLAELRPRAAEFWTEPLPEVGGWPDAPCGYLLLSAPYQSAADSARRAGWPTRHLPAGHFHLLVDPHAVVDALLALFAEATHP